ncbi:hypothetical protein [Amorphus sp. MBR-141]
MNRETERLASLGRLTQCAPGPSVNISMGEFKFLLSLAERRAIPEVTQAAIEASARFFREAMPKMNVGASALDANAIDAWNKAECAIGRAVEVRDAPPEGDGRPFSADEAIVKALEIDDHFGRLAFLTAWREGAWRECLEMVEEGGDRHDREAH